MLPSIADGKEGKMEIRRFVDDKTQKILDAGDDTAAEILLYLDSAEKGNEKLVSAVKRWNEDSGITAP